MKATTHSTMARIALAGTALALLAACSEKPQMAGTRKDDAQAWQGARDAFAVPGWKAGDKASWEEQIRKRNAGQNEYVRIAH